jgi:hypothetical protein
MMEILGFLHLVFGVLVKPFYLHESMAKILIFLLISMGAWLWASLTSMSFWRMLFDNKHYGIL